MKTKDVMRKVLKENDNNIAQVARLLGVSRAYVTNIKEGLVVPGRTVIEDICELVGADPMKIEDYRMKLAKEIVEDDREMAETVVRVYLSKQEREKKEQKKGKKVV